MKSAALAKTPQAVVKLIGYTHKQASIKRQAKYISRNGTEPLENEFGERLEGDDVDKKVLESWEGRVEQGTARNGKPNRLSMHLQISAPAGTDTEKFKDIAREWGAQAFEGRRYVYVVHEDRKHPHAHYLVALEGEDGKKLDPRKKDLQAWREQYAEIASSKGVSMTATKWHEHRKERPPKEASNSAQYRIAERGEVSRKSVSELRKAMETSSGTVEPEPIKRSRSEHKRLAEVHRGLGRGRLGEAHEQEAISPRRGRLDSLKDAIDRGDPAISKRMLELAAEVAKEHGIAAPESGASFREVREFLNDHARRSIPVGDVRLPSSSTAPESASRRSYEGDEKER